MSQNGRALISALNNGDYDALDRISLSEGDIRIVNQRVHELFERAIGGENLPLFEALLQIPQVKISGKEYCALRHAAQLGLAEYLQRLEGHRGVKPSLKDKSGFSALHLAMVGRWPEGRALPLVRILLGFSGLKVNGRNLEKKTALHYAMDKEWYEIAELLMDAGANPNIEDAEGKSATNIGLMATLPDSLFGKMLSFTGSPDDFDDEEEDEDAEPPLPDGTMSPEDVYRQMNSHKPEDMQTPDPLLTDLTDPDRKVKFPQDPRAPHTSTPSPQQPPVYQPPPNPIGSPVGRNPNPDHHRAVDPLTTQIPSVNHAPSTPIKASPRDFDAPPKTNDPSFTHTPADPSPPAQSDYIKPHTPPSPINQEDTDDFHSIMGAETVEELAADLDRTFLLSRSEFDTRFKLHRAAVIDRLAGINTVLKKKGQALRAEDFRVPDPTTGFNLWHVAAATGKFELALEVLASNGEWPVPDDLGQRTEVGKSIPDVLDDMNRLSGVLHSEVWGQKPKLLAALLAQLPPHRQQQFTRLITRTNLQILHG